jgi:hypothetical protein
MCANWQFETDSAAECSANGFFDCPQAQMTASRNAAAQTKIAATNAESNARSFLRSVRDVSHQPWYVRMLVMVPSPDLQNRALNRRSL